MTGPVEEVGGEERSTWSNVVLGGQKRLRWTNLYPGGVEEAGDCD